MTKPTEAEIVAWSDVEFTEVTAIPVTVLIDRAWSYLAWATGLALDTLADGALMEGTGGAAIKPLIQQAVQAKVEGLAYANQPEIAETAADFHMIQSFSAGPYSETRRSLQDLRLGGMIDADPRVNALLWPLLADERRDDWLAWLSGKPLPAFEVVDMAWTEPDLDDVVYEHERWQSAF